MVLGNDRKRVYIISSIVIDDNLLLLKFINKFFYLSTPLRPNITKYFKSEDLLQLLLQTLMFLHKFEALSELLKSRSDQI